MWNDLQDSIKETTKAAEDYQSEITKINEQMKELGMSQTEKLKERYAAASEELIKLNKELAIYTKYNILTDADAAKKLELE
jgi:peptidoglycan hydrolase CwlO-like protein